MDFIKPGKTQITGKQKKLSSKYLKPCQISLERLTRKKYYKDTVATLRKNLIPSALSFTAMDVMID